MSRSSIPVATLATTLEDNLTEVARTGPTLGIQPQPTDSTASPNRPIDVAVVVVVDAPLDFNISSTVDSILVLESFNDEALGKTSPVVP
mmetsp:Transcript_2437/g.5453  ORF Transcript_2437/g.5453 Transcript_2437/m.5453 type:complete len:89 (+) Transcript_2437:2064-2330(+)